MAAYSCKASKLNRLLRRYIRCGKPAGRDVYCPGHLAMLAGNAAKPVTLSIETRLRMVA